MKHFVRALVLLVLAGATPSALAQAPCQPPDNETRVAGGKECLVIRTFRPANPGSEPKLLIFIHGDLSGGGPADYIYERAREALAEGRVVVSLVRPGYADGEGNQSTGDNFGRNDSYTAHNVDAVAAAIKTLREHHKASYVVLVGHSGGAAISGVILGRHPGLVAGAVLAACPCDIAAWRAGRRAWRQSLSPDDFLKRVPVTTRVITVTGDKDDNTRPILAEDYAKTLAKRGVPARFVLVPGAGHNDVMRRPEVRAAVEDLVSQLGR